MHGLLLKIRPSRDPLESISIIWALDYSTIFDFIFEFNNLNIKLNLGKDNNL